MRKVITLDNRQFQDACSELAEMTAHRFGRPDLIIGIKRGGEYVAQLVAKEFPEATLASVTLQRPTTPLKQILGGLPALLPRKVADILRVIEADRRKRKDNQKIHLPSVNIPLSLQNQIFDKVLIVDDAVDTGVTLAAVKQTVKQALPQSQLLSAAIVQTESNACLSPDVVLISDGSLIRFPWSADASSKVKKEFKSELQSLQHRITVQ